MCGGVVARSRARFARWPPVTSRSMRRSWRSRDESACVKARPARPRTSFASCGSPCSARSTTVGRAREKRSPRPGRRRLAEQPASDQGGRRRRRGGVEGAAQDHVASLARTAAALRRDLAGGRRTRRGGAGEGTRGRSRRHAGAARRPHGSHRSETATAGPAPGRTVVPRSRQARPGIAARGRSAAHPAVSTRRRRPRRRRQPRRARLGSGAGCRRRPRRSSCAVVVHARAPRSACSSTAAAR